MEKKKPCSGDCDNCDLPEKLFDMLVDAVASKRPVLQLTQADKGVASIFLSGKHNDVVKMIFNAIQANDDIEEIFMDVMSLQSQHLMKEKMGIDLSELKRKFEEEFMPRLQPKPKGEC